MNEAGKTPLTAEEILASELYGVLKKAKGESAALSPYVVTQKIRAAEDYYEHALNLYFERRRVKSDPESRPGDPVEAGSWDVEEPAYDYPQDFFTGERWGYLELKHRPIASIDALFFAYPGATTRALNFQEWVRLDKKNGRLFLIPKIGTQVGTFELSAWFAGLLGGGSRGLPHALYVDYVAGYTKSELLRDHMDLLEGVRLRATLLLFGILSNVRTQGLGSQSLSEDGLSRSQSMATGKFGPYSAAVQLAIDNEKEIFERWERTQLGVPFVVC